MLIVGSSECGKSTLLAQVIFQVFKKSNGFITTFMSPSYDSLPIQKLILENLSEKRKAKKKAASSDKDNPLGFELDDLYKTKEWLFTKRGFDSNYCHKIYNMRLRLYKNYNDAEKVREFRFVLALDDEIDIGGHLIRKVCLTWRNKGISWVQLVQDITNLDCAVRNSAPIVFFGHMNFPHRRKQICEDYLSPYIPGADIWEKMDLYSKMTADKCFLLMNHRLRKCYHLNTHTGAVTELPELQTSKEHDVGFYQVQKTLAFESEPLSGSEKKRKNRDDQTAKQTSVNFPVAGNKKRKTCDGLLFRLFLLCSFLKSILWLRHLRLLLSPGKDLLQSCQSSVPCRNHLPMWCTIATRGML